MKRFSFFWDEEAVSIALGYMLTLTTSLLLLSLMLIYFVPPLVDTSSKIVVWERLGTIGNQIAVKITDFDRLVGAHTSGKVLNGLNTTLKIPWEIGNYEYTINITQDEIILKTPREISNEVRVPLNVSSVITNKEISSTGEKIRIFYNLTSGAIDFEEYA